MKSRFAGIGLVCLCLSIVSLASAQETDRFEGRVGLGVMFIDSANNLNPKGSKKYLDNLNSAPEKELSTIPVLLPSVSYDVGEQDGWKLYLNTDPPIDEAGSFGFNLGAVYPLHQIGIIDISTFFTPFEKAWKDPYLTGADRDETSTSKIGARLAFNRIMGSGLRINVVYLHDDVDDDKIGQSIPGLERDGAVYALNANYSFYFFRSLEIRPRLSIRKGAYEGDSNSFSKIKTELEASYRLGRFMLMPRIYYSYTEYDEVHPKFGRTREEDGYGIMLMASCMAPMGWQDWSAQMLLGYSKGDSNIAFFDNESYSGGLFLSYHF